MKNFLAGTVIVCFSILVFLKSNYFFESSVSFSILGLFLMIIGIIQIVKSEKNQINGTRK
jgi:uncharacterized membrane protein HdeD (DUF308 family)